MKFDSLYEKMVIPKITKEMKEHNEKRTKAHIDRVIKYAKKIEKKYPEQFKGLEERAKDHDKSKFKDPEAEPYIWVNWKYKLQKEGKNFDIPKSILDKMYEATTHHVKHNKHHPEYHCDRKINLINKEDRHKPPSQIIDATKMDDMSIAEMTADWMAMGEELNNKAKDWADSNIGVRWNFTPEQTELIYKLIKLQ